MGLGPSKDKIRKILEKSISNVNSNLQKDLKIEYKYVLNEKIQTDSNQNIPNETSTDIPTEDSFNFSQEIVQVVDSNQLDIKNVKLFPHSTIGTLIVRFDSDKDEYFTCFLIDTNVVVTLSSNLVNKNKGGKARSIMTTFSEEKVKWENIHFQNEKKEKGKKEDSESLDSMSQFSKLAVILYEENISSEWIGVEGGKRDDFSGRDLNAVFTLGVKDDINDENKKIKCPLLREINVSNGNPFQQTKDLVETNDDEESKKEEIKSLLSKCPGSPLYYKDYNSGAYVVAIINENLEFQYLDVKTMSFLIEKVNQGKLLRKKVHKGIDEENIVKLDLSRNDFGPLDIKYLTDFDLKNLRILDLSSNSIKPQGAFYLSQGKFSNLESLNLNFNEIGDEGLNHIANGFFSKLNYLYLFHNNISVEGIQFLVKAEFVNNLVILSLSENPNIGDTGMRIMKEHKGWSKLNTLNLNSTGLTDVSLTYLGEASMPKLKKLNILGNKFTEVGKPSINGLRMNHIHVSYRTQQERDREKKLKEAREKKDRK